MKNIKMHQFFIEVEYLNSNQGRHIGYFETYGDAIKAISRIYKEYSYTDGYGDIHIWQLLPSEKYTRRFVEVLTIPRFAGES